MGSGEAGWHPSPAGPSRCVVPIRRPGRRFVYGGDVESIKPFGAGDLRAALAKVAAHGRQARTIDAGLRAVAMLKERPAALSRVLLFSGHPMDSGSESNMEALRDQAEHENVTVYAVTLPEFNKAFASDTFSLQGLSSQSDRGGFKAGVDLGKLIPTLSRSGAAQAATDPFSTLTAATGGTQFHIRKQRELESAPATIGVSLRSACVLSYPPSGTEEGFHNIGVEVNVNRSESLHAAGLLDERELKRSQDKASVENQRRRVARSFRKAGSIHPCRLTLAARV